MIMADLKYCYEYPRVAHTVDAIIIAKCSGGDMILLIERKFDPFRGMWALPGGFIGMEETLGEACGRELFEETGLQGISLNQYYTFDEVGRDPRHRTISTAFWGYVTETFPVNGGDDAATAAWFPVGSLPEMAFDHGRIIRKFIADKL